MSDTQGGELEPGEPKKTPPDGHPWKARITRNPVALGTIYFFLGLVFVGCGGGGSSEPCNTSTLRQVPLNPNTPPTGSGTPTPEPTPTPDPITQSVGTFTIIPPLDNGESTGPVLVGSQLQREPAGLRLNLAMGAGGLTVLLPEKAVPASWSAGPGGGNAECVVYNTSDGPLTYSTAESGTISLNYLQETPSGKRVSGLVHLQIGERVLEAYFHVPYTESPLP